MLTGSFLGLRLVFFEIEPFISRFAVSTVMIVTSTFIAIHIYITKGLPIYVSIAFFLFFGFFDGLFFGAALKKIPHGAWVPLTIGCIL